MLEKLKKLKWYWWFVIIALITGLVQRLDPNYKAKQAAKQQSEQQASLAKESNHSCASAYIISKKYVLPFLAVPKSADFPMFDFKCQQVEGYKFNVMADVDCKNLMGVPLKINYIAQMQFLGGDESSPNSWKLLDLIIDGKKVSN